MFFKESVASRLLPIYWAKQYMCNHRSSVEVTTNSEGTAWLNQHKTWMPHKTNNENIPKCTVYAITPV